MFTYKLFAIQVAPTNYFFPLFVLWHNLMVCILVTDKCLLIVSFKITLVTVKLVFTSVLVSDMLSEGAVTRKTFIVALAKVTHYWGAKFVNSP